MEDLDQVRFNLRQVTNRLRAVRMCLPQPGSLLVFRPEVRPAQVSFERRGLLSDLNDGSVFPSRSDVFMVVAFDFDGDAFKALFWTFRQGRLVFTTLLTPEEFCGLFVGIDEPPEAA